MRWQGLRRSSNVQQGGGMGRVAVGGVGAVVVAIIAMLFGVNPADILDGGGGSAAPGVEQPGVGTAPGSDTLTAFVSAVLGSTEDTWSAIFQQRGGQYRDPTLVLYSGAVQSACGFTQAAVGPFYCPGDEKVYLDLSFFRELRSRFQAPGDFAEAYVIAHEVGHHVQKLLGIEDRVHRAMMNADRTEANALSVRLELQADCLAGVWADRANQTQHFLEPGDIDEALGAASAVGDDRLQEEAQGYVVPDSFTHGSSAQRTHWFKQGFQSGRIDACDTFSAGAP